MHLIHYWSSFVLRLLQFEQQTGQLGSKTFFIRERIPFEEYLDCSEQKQMSFAEYY